jgi:hypothetical protein
MYSGDITQPSPEGLSRVLRESVARDPVKFAPEAMKFAAVDPTYGRGLIMGLEGCMKANTEVDWRQPLELCRWVVGQPRKIDGRKTVRFEQDPDWGYCRRAIASMLQAGLAGNTEAFGPDLRDSIWQVLLPLTDDPNPSPEQESKSTRDAYNRGTRDRHPISGSFGTSNPL